MNKRSRIAISLLVMLLFAGGIWAYASSTSPQNNAAPRVIVQKQIKVIRVQEDPRTIPASSSSEEIAHANTGATSYETEEYEEEEHEEEEHEEDEYEDN